MSEESENEYNMLVEFISDIYDATAGQMFGKKCIKVNNKAGIALFQDCIVFKLTGPSHEEALALEGSMLWDPSGKGRAMKEWVQVTLQHKTEFKRFAQVAADYVGKL